MRTVLKEDAAASRTELVALLVPEGARAVLPDAAPAAASWKADFGDKGNRAARGLMKIRSFSPEKWS